MHWLQVMLTTRAITAAVDAQGKLSCLGSLAQAMPTESSPGHLLLELSTFSTQFSNIVTAASP